MGKYTFYIKLFKLLFFFVLTLLTYLKVLCLSQWDRTSGEPFLLFFGFGHYHLQVLIPTLLEYKTYTNKLTLPCQLKQQQLDHLRLITNITRD